MIPNTLASMPRSEVCVAMPLCVPLPVEVLCPEQAFPFLDLTLTDLGVDPGSVRERVVWVDSKRTWSRSASGKVREREALVLEVRVTAQRPGPGGQTQEILYGTETHSQRRYFKTVMEVQPWIKSEGEEEKKPDGVPVFSEPAVGVVFALDTETRPKWQKTEEKLEV
ncbi:uncharacterized protein si:ch211-196f5.2 [Polyodon spathula]|uniref:uncharacterized protein si:ch211-196f5.2 n=1 Tax=Polyodon spathula TaxID=7913 RepID=UPI001B7E3CA9|nr:uncharacterized protein si:ch211-196f5.2 [Polyodon spathula]